MIEISGHILAPLTGVLLDRRTHHVHILEMNGESFRLNRSRTPASGETDPVGSHPKGATPEGVFDLAGNEAEWTSSLFKPYPYDAADGREDPKAKSNPPRLARDLTETSRFLAEAISILS